MAGGTKTRAELIEIAGSTATNLDPHLRKLYRAGLVTRTRDGQSVIYRLVGGRVTKDGITFTHPSGARAVVPWTTTGRPPT